MTEAGKRIYSSELRDGQARETRRRIVAAAGTLYARDGFAPTTIDAIAEAAGVSRKTVFTSVGGKVELLKLAYDFALAGDDEPVPMFERPTLRAIIDEPDPYVAIRMYGAFVTEMGRRISGLYIALRGAAEMDLEARELYDRWERDRVEAMRNGPVASFIKKKVLRKGLRPDEAADILSVLVQPALYHRLVTQQGWKASRYQAWLTRSLQELVMEPHPATEA